MCLARYDGSMKIPKLPPPKESITIAAILAGLAVLFFYSVAALGFLRPGSTSFKIAKEAATSTPVIIAPAPDRTRMFAVMIDNHPEAAYIFDILVEGGLTRMMAVYGNADVPKIGPVRSARPYFLDWARELEAVYVHVGGSDEALRLLTLPSTGLDDINEFRYGAWFFRDKNRRAPHSTYTSSAEMRDLIAERGWKQETDADVATLRAEKVAVDSATSASAIVIRHGNGRTVSNWTYDAGTKTYDQKGYDAAPKTLVVMDIPVLNVYDPHAKGLIGLQDIGTGKATVFRDGIAIPATWTKKTREARLEVRDENDAVIPYAYGQVWIIGYASNRNGSVTFK